MSKRKQVLIDKKFQLRTAFSIIQAVYCVFAVIVAVIIATAVYNNRRLEGTVLNQKHVLNGQYDAFSSLLVMARGESCTIDQINRTSDKMAAELDRSMLMGRANIGTIESIIKGNYLLVFSILVLVFIQGVFLFFLIIRKTHRISGPAQIMVGYMNDVMEGKAPDFRPLRESDELQELYDTFGRFVEHIKK